ncbi:MAG TPA: hypothetical protein VMF65_20940 [Acidimicrobiales bacterium]|nr:hypothetical protein [Acidimicrobiales bacterium]
MLPWTMKVMAEERLSDLRREGGQAGRRYPAAYDGGEARRAKQHTTRWQRLSERAGYRMITVGCRLARPAVLARVQADI